MRLLPEWGFTEGNDTPEPQQFGWSVINDKKGILVQAGQAGQVGFGVGKCVSGFPVFLGTFFHVSVSSPWVTREAINRFCPRLQVDSNLRIVTIVGVNWPRRLTNLGLAFR